jgi:phage baseplate assembly protein W
MAIGISFPFRIEDGELPAASDAEESVADSIKSILNTRVGERVMRPDFGSKVWDIVFENIDALSLARVKDEVRRALTLNEPRIRVLSVSASPAESGRGGSITVDITYRLAGQVQTTSTEVGG